MKNESVKQAVANGEVPEIVALIAYLNSLKIIEVINGL